MSTENNHDAERDAAVSAVFRELSAEETPARIDHRIIELATTEVRPRYVRGPRWTRPLAWAAMIVVTSTIVLQVADMPETPELQQPMEAPMEPPGPPGSADFGAPRADMLEQANELARERAGISGAQAARAASGSAGPATLEAGPARPCDEADRATPEAWFACIEALQESGRATAAEQELEALREAFPDFAPP